MAFVNRVGRGAEAANHHPDILVHGWNHVRLTLSTHSEGGLTDNDLELARAIDGLWLRVGAAALVAVAVLGAALAPVAQARRVRVFAVGPRFELSWVQSPEPSAPSCSH